MSLNPDDKYFLAATKEFDRGDIDEARWARLLVVHTGDETKAKYQYIAERARELASAEREAAALTSQASRDRQMLLERLRSVRGDDKIIVDALAELNIFAEKADDGLWRVYLPDGSVLTTSSQRTFHDYAQEIFEHYLL